MSYLVVNEDALTGFHNAWTRGISGGNGNYANTKFNGFGGALIDIFRYRSIDPFSIALSVILNNAFGFIDKIDNAYFNRFWSISKENEKELRKVVYQVPDAVPVTINKLNSREFGEFNPDDIMARRHTRKATRSFGDGMVTTCTSYYKLPVNKNGNHDKGFFILYFTFDAHRIYDIKVLCKVPKADPEDNSSYYVETLPITAKRINIERLN